MGASQQRRARRAQKHGEQQTIGPGREAAVNTKQDSASIHEPQYAGFQHKKRTSAQERFSDKWQHAALPLSSVHDFDTLSHPYHMMGGIAPETLFDTPSTISKVATQGADAQVTDTAVSDIHEKVDRMAHSIVPPFEHTNKIAPNPLTVSVTSHFATATTTFTFGSSLAFPCDFGKEQPLADYSTVFEVSHLEVQSNHSHKTAVKGKSIFHAIQDRISGAATPEANTNSMSSTTHSGNNVEYCLQSDKNTSKTATTFERPSAPQADSPLHLAHNPGRGHQQGSDDRLRDLVLALPLVQAHWSWSSNGLLLDKLADIVSSKLAIWAQHEAQRLVTEHQRFLCLRSQPTCTDVQHNMALVLYKLPFSSKPVTPPPKSVTSGRGVPDLWYTKRIFFVDIEGITRIIDCRKMMYDIEVVSDNGATDFDSIASPLKIIPRSICYSEPTTASTREYSDDSIEIEDLGDFVEIGATFHTSISAWNEAVSTSDISMSFKEDEDVIDPRLVFFPAKQVDVIELAEETDYHGRNPVQVHQGFTSYELPMTPVLHEPSEVLEANLSAIKESIFVVEQDELIDDLPLASPGSPTILSEDNATCDEDVSSISLMPFPDFYTNLPDPALFQDDGGSPSDAVEANPLNLPQWLADNLEEDAHTADVTEAFSSDWASEVMRMTLGTESFFTLLMKLDTIEENVATEEAVVQAFLELVNTERNKSGRKALPSSYTAAAVLASKIVPHTIFLGTISLASLLAALSFDDERKVTVDDIYHVFRDISAADVYYQTTARKGVLGALGRRLGKIFV